MRSLLSAATAMALAALSSASQPVTNCPLGSQLCYTVSVPSSSANSNGGPIFFQIQAPASSKWAALGQGTEMAGANIFMIYADAATSNITLSPRLGLGQVEPLYDSAAQVELLEGSGISGGLMTANIRCNNCNSWSGGSMSFTDKSSNWIFSSKSGSPVDSNSPSENVPQHDIYGTLNFDLSSATGGSDSINPFTSGNSSAASTPKNGSSPGAASGSGYSYTDWAMLSQATIAHGTLMGLTAVVLFPSGAIIRRSAPGSSIWLHAAMQMFGLFVLTVGAGLGIWIATKTHQLAVPHSIIGLVVFALAWLQPVGGLLQHAHFKRKGNRGPFGWLHLVLGFSVILLGMINGGLGLQLTDNTVKGEIAYGVVAGVVGVVWLAVTVLGEIRKARTSRGEKDDRDGIVNGNGSGSGNDNENGNGNGIKSEAT